MADLSSAVEVLLKLQTMSPRPQPMKTEWEGQNTSENISVPIVPAVPAKNISSTHQPRCLCPHAVIERAAIIEYSGGFTRDEAEQRALNEFGIATWREVIDAEQKDLSQ